MSERRPPFGSEELPPSSAADDLRGSLALGRDLEALAGEPVPSLAPDWVDGVMAAVALEPTPAPALAAGRALRAGRPMALVAAIVDAWRVGFGGGRPVLVRLPALALLLIAVVSLGSVATIGGYAGGRALGLFPNDSSVTPLPTPSATPEPTIVVPPSPSVSPSLAPAPSTTPASSPPPSTAPVTTPPASPDDTHDTETASPSDDDGGNSGPGGGGGDDNSGRGSDDGR